MSVQDHTGGAKPTLQGAMVDKGFLQRVQMPILRQALDGKQILSLDIFCRELTGALRFPVDQDRAGSTIPLSASELCSGEPEIGPYQPKKPGVGIDFKGHGLAIEFEYQFIFHRLLRTPL
jgi:hypothetical protein